MDREILFRGKRLDKFRPGEWIYGYYVPCCFGSFPCRPAIVPEPDGQWEPFEVDPTTVGQYTGLTDKNGMKIFEGDIVFISEWEEITDVYWRLGAWLLRFRDSDEFLSETAESCEIIGNIHNNPELIGGEGDA